MQLAGDVVFENLVFNVTSYPSGTTPNVVTNKYNVTFGEGVTTSGSWGMPMYLTMTRWSINENDVTLDFLTNKSFAVKNIYLGSDVDYSGYKGTLNFNFGGSTSSDNVTLGRGVSTSTSIEGTINYNLTGNSSINTLTMGTLSGGGAFTLKGLRYIRLSDNAKIGTVYLTAETAMAGKTREGVTVLEINGGTLSIEMAQGDTDAMDSNGKLVVNGGTITITAQFAFDFETGSEFNGGKITVNGQEVTQITESMMTGGRGGMMNDQRKNDRQTETPDGETGPTEDHGGRKRGDFPEKGDFPQEGEQKQGA
jgi:hypothetical protein